MTVLKITLRTVLSLCLLGAGVICVSTTAGAQSAKAVISGEIKAAAGGYVLMNEAQSRACRVLLRPEAVSDGIYAIGFPLTCKAAFPLLSEVTGWRLHSGATGSTATLDFVTQKGELTVNFRERTGSLLLEGRWAKGELFLLEPGNKRALSARLDAEAGKRPVGVKPISRAPEQPQASAMKAAPGTYRLERRQSQETGCVLILRGETGVQNAPAPAVLQAGCSDRGTMFFGPTGWYVTGASLYLTNAKNQKLSFSLNRRGDWEKEAGQGDSLILRRQ